MRQFPRLLLVLVIVTSLLPGCALWHKFHDKRRAAERERIPKPAQLIGTITLFNTDSAFALIDDGSRPSPSVGTMVQSRSADGSTAQLRVTEVRKRPFVVADIVSGTPHKGDEVFQ